MVNSNVKVNSAGELIALLKREHGKFNFGSIGAGSLSHLAMEAIALASGTQHGARALPRLARGDDRDHPRRRANGLPACDRGDSPCRVRRGENSRGLDREALALSCRTIPTLKEAGIDVEADAWNGLIAPAGTPEPIVAKIRREVIEAIETQAVRDKLAAQLMEPIGSTPAEFRARIEAEIARWAPVIKAAEIKVN